MCWCQVDPGVRRREGGATTGKACHADVPNLRTWRLPQSLFLFSPSPVVVERTASFLVMDVHICRSTVLFPLCV